MGVERTITPSNGGGNSYEGNDDDVHECNACKFR
jgi:hypothetical protein